MPGRLCPIQRFAPLPTRVCGKPWRETLAELKEDLANVRAERLEQATAEEAEFQQQRDELS